MVDGLRLVPPQAGRLLLGRPAPDVLRQLDLRRVLHDADIDSIEAIAVRGSSRAKAANTFSDWLIAAVRRVQGRRNGESPEFERAGLHGTGSGNHLQNAGIAFGGRRMCLRFKVLGLIFARYWALTLSRRTPRPCEACIPTKLSQVSNDGFSPDADSVVQAAVEVRIACPWSSPSPWTSGAVAPPDPRVLVVVVVVVAVRCERVRPGDALAHALLDECICSMTTAWIG